ncbi:MAG: DUF3108 domain-containing protein [Betaproteobacteria bacterium]|nr:DUF3108 domain-containing protein [Betaproteobacteria bacterium]
MTIRLLLAIAATALSQILLHPVKAADSEDSVSVPAVDVIAERFKLVETAPLRVEMTISVEMSGITVGEGRDSFEHDGDRYRVVSEARTAGLARALKRVDEKRESRGLVTGHGIRPLYFRQERTGKRPKTATFDWEAGKLKLSEGEESETVDLPEFVLDQTSLPYAFVFVEAPRTGKFNVHVTDGRRLTAYEVGFVGEEKIKTKLGALDTLHYRKIQRGEDRRGFEFWLSLDHHRLPVRIRIVEKDGTAFDSNVTRLDFKTR